jgi:hypothetical protein
MTHHVACLSCRPIDLTKYIADIAPAPSLSAPAMTMRTCPREATGLHHARVSRQPLSPTNDAPPVLRGRTVS